jgi:hypothetical protein
MILIWIVFTIFAIAVGLFALLLFSPVVAGVDTQSRRITVHWSFLLAYTRPLPGSHGSRQLAIAGIAVPLPGGKRKKAAKKKEKPRVAGLQERRQHQQKKARLLWNCLLDDDVRPALMRRFRRLPADVWQAVEVSRWHSNISLPDPALNGILWGATAALDWGRRARVKFNFLGSNEVQTEVRLYPHRVAKALLKFLFLLPYRGMYKQWRAS